MHKRALHPRSREIVAKPVSQPSTVKLSDFTEYQGIQPGKFWTTADRLDGILDQLIAQKKVPKVTMSNYTVIKQLQLDDMTVRAFPAD